MLFLEHFAETGYTEIRFNDRLYIGRERPDYMHGIRATVTGKGAKAVNTTGSTSLGRLFRPSSSEDNEVTKRQKPAIRYGFHRHRRG